MFRPMRRKDRELSHADAVEVLKNGDFGVICYNNEGGHPCGIPFNYGSTEDAIYIHAANDGGTAASLEANGKASFTVVTRCDIDASDFSTNYTSAVAFGNVTFVEGEEKFFGLKILLEKYMPEVMEAGIEHIHEAIADCKVMKLSIEHLTGKRRNM